ncbi:unnamed protein product [Dovyalis caffra]|uniref:Exonuclease domain-containing protein n=1 Tax=Dovyalis caffra TaxID=77055 RepID=A0AAV1RNW2_9ROSI|nr:unnamed protein product [Dovyalis caffra]
MDTKLAAAPDKNVRQVLAEVVRLAQKQGRKGSQGDWKQFLNVYDRKFGSGFSDPARRSRDSLVAFLQTFNDEDGLKFVDNVLRSHSNCEMLKEIIKESPDNESPEQRLVRSTLEHPLYLSKYAFPSYEKGWVATKVRKKSKLLRCNEMLAVDCEMVLCKDGTDALVRVCVVDCNLKVKLDELVNPCKPVEDYRTEITGVTADVLDGASCSLADVQSVLGYELRKEGDPHNCLDDACAAMKLVLAKIERGVDNYIPLIEPDVKNVPETEMAKLLLHRIPVTVPREKLRILFPANYAIEIKRTLGLIMASDEVILHVNDLRNSYMILITSVAVDAVTASQYDSNCIMFVDLPLTISCLTHKVVQGVGYSVLAIFKNPEEASRAFENLNGSLEKDRSGRPQKQIAIQLDTGVSVSIRVRKMAHDNFICQVSQQKRPFEGEDSGDPKKLKIDRCEDQVKEIERLKQEVREKDLNRCDDHLKEIERLKQELKEHEFN